MLNSKVYDYLKWSLLILFPAVAALSTSLGPLWGWDVVLVAKITGTINAIGVFLGLLVGVSYVQYKGKEK